MPFAWSKGSSRVPCNKNSDIVEPIYPPAPSGLPDIPISLPFQRFSVEQVVQEVDYHALNNIAINRKKYLITNTELEVNELVKINSIDDIELQHIQDCVFFFTFQFG